MEQVIEPDVALYRDLFTDVILERVSRRNGTVDSIDQYAVSKLIRSIRIYKHSIHNLIDFRVQCLAGLSATTRLNLSLADVVQLYVCCFQHRSIFEYCWKQVVPVMNHTIQHSCERFRISHVYDIDAVVRTLVDSSTAVGTTVAADDGVLVAAETAEAAALRTAAGAGELSAPVLVAALVAASANVPASAPATPALAAPAPHTQAEPGIATPALALSTVEIGIATPFALSTAELGVATPFALSMAELGVATPLALSTLEVCITTPALALSTENTPSLENENTALCGET